MDIEDTDMLSYIWLSTTVFAALGIYWRMFWNILSTDKEGLLKQDSSIAGK